MRILQIVTRSEPGGAQTMVATLASELAERGHAVAIASGPEGGGGAFLGIDQRVETFVVEGLQRAIAPVMELRALRNTTRLYTAWKPDIVHLHTSKAGAIGRMAPGIDPRRIVYTMHGYDQLRTANRKLLALDKALRHRCGAVVAVSRRDLEAMRADGYAPLLVPNGVADARRMEPPNKALSERLSELRKRGLPVALAAARDARPKRVDLLRETARRLSGIATIAWIGGDPAPGDPENFVALGAAAGAASCFGQVDLALLASDHEGMPMSILEAFSAGIPVVASAVGGVPEALGLDVAGLGPRGCAVLNESVAFAAAIAHYVEDSSARIAACRAAREAWESEYSSAVMATRYLEIYKSLVHAGVRPA